MNQKREASKDSGVAARFSEITYKIIGAAMRVHNQLGPGLKEVHYHKALSLALIDGGVSFEDEKPLQVLLHDSQVGLLFIDHFVENAIVVEEKAFSHMLTDEETAQVLTYLAVADAQLALLLNFGRPRLEYKRILPPRSRSQWTERAARYVWRPSHDASNNPLIRSVSADDSTSAVHQSVPEQH